MKFATKWTRREFLQASSLLTLAPAVPSLFQRMADPAQKTLSERALVVLQLDGGNDGLNTVVPFRDEAYRKARPTLQLTGKEVVPIADGLGLHPSLQPLAKQFEGGDLAILQGVGYPQPNRSHFESMKIWHTGKRHPDAGETGWIGRSLDLELPDSSRPASVYAGRDDPPHALQGKISFAEDVDRLEEMFLEGPAHAPLPSAGVSGRSALLEEVARRQKSAAETAARLHAVGARSSRRGSYPATALGERLRMFSAFLQEDLRYRILYTVHPGYDTHSSQSFAHASLLEDVATSVAAFYDDLREHGLAQQVVTLIFSEFGRCLKENQSRGTDHGTAAPVLLAGPAVEGGFYGTPASLTDLEDGEPKPTLDFRRIYATLLEHWIDLPPAKILGGDFESLPLFQA